MRKAIILSLVLIIAVSGAVFGGQDEPGRLRSVEIPESLASGLDVELCRLSRAPGTEQLAKHTLLLPSLIQQALAKIPHPKGSAFNKWTGGAGMPVSDPGDRKSMCRLMLIFRGTYSVLSERAEKISFSHLAWLLLQAELAQIIGEQIHADLLSKGVFHPAEIFTVDLVISRDPKAWEQDQDRVEGFSFVLVRLIPHIRILGVKAVWSRRELQHLLWFNKAATLSDLLPYKARIDEAVDSFRK